MNVPLVLVALGCQALLRYPEPATRSRLNLDWFGALAFGAMLAFVTLSLNSLGGAGGLPALAAGVSGFAVMGAVFFQSQRSSARPIVEWRLFGNRTFLAATGYVLLSNLVMYTTLFSIPFFVEEVQGKGSATTGTLLGSMSVLVAFVAPAGGRLSDSHGRRLPAMAGSVVALVAMIALLAGLSADVSYWYLAVVLASLGLGLGLSIGPSNTAAIESAPRELAGTASGTNSMMRYLGSIVGAGLLGAVLSSEGGGPEVGLFRLIFVVLVAMAALACVTTLFIHRFPSTYEEPEPAAAAELPAASPATPGS
ncbi:MAG: MFS transporter, partial [Chloroflexi bacterium]|nr:MFS transporter [Chloroflexota bacterium]